LKLIYSEKYQINSWMYFWALELRSFPERSLGCGVRNPLFMQAATDFFSLNSFSGRPKPLIGE
jgi:hypothetical protein